MGAENFLYYEFDEYKIDTRRRTLFKNGERVKLTSRIFDLLLVLVQNEGRVLEHNELLDKVWEGTFVEQSNLKKGISALRQALGEQPNESFYIRTIPRRGYSFVANVHAISDPQSEPVYVKEIREEIIVEEEIYDAEFDEKIIEIQPPSTKLLTTSNRNDNKVRSQRKLLSLAALIVLILCLLGFAAWKFSPRAKVSAEELKLENIKIQKLTTTGNISQATISPDGKTVVYATFDSTGKQALWTRRIGQSNALQLVAPDDVQYNAIVISPDNNSIYYGITSNKTQDILNKISIVGGVPRKITENLASTATFSPDGKRLAFVRDTPDKMRRLIIVNAEDGSDEKEIYAVSDNHKLIEPKWSPDGKKFVFVASDVTEKGRYWGLAEISSEGGEVRQILPPQVGKVYTSNWLRDGSGLIICAEPTGTRQTQLWRVNYPNGQVTRLTNDVSSYDDVNLSDDANTILTIQSEKNGDLWSVNWTMLQNTVRLTESQNFNGYFTVLPDGRILGEYIENGQFGLQFVNADGSNPQPVFAQINSERTPSVTPDGKSILFTSRRSGTQEIWRTDLDGRNPQKLTEEKSFLSFPKQTLDGREIFFERYDGARWRLVKMPASGGEIVQIAPDYVGVYSFSPDGNSFAYSYLDEQKKRWMVAIRNVSDNALLRQFEISPISLLDWTPDGKNLIYNDSETFRDGGSLWQQPLDGAPPKLILEAKEDRVYWAAWSPNKQKLYLTRGRTISNIVLLTKQNQ